jgi:hypothetical protein
LLPGALRHGPLLGRRREALSCGCCTVQDHRICLAGILCALDLVIQSPLATASALYARPCGSGGDGGKHPWSVPHLPSLRGRLPSPPPHPRPLHCVRAHARRRRLVLLRRLPGGARRARGGAVAGGLRALLPPRLGRLRRPPRPPPTAAGSPLRARGRQARRRRRGGGRRGAGLGCSGCGAAGECGRDGGRGWRPGRRLVGGSGHSARGRSSRGGCGGRWQQHAGRARVFWPVPGGRAAAPDTVPAKRPAEACRQHRQQPQHGRGVHKQRRWQQQREAARRPLPRHRRRRGCG